MYVNSTCFAGMQVRIRWLTIACFEIEINGFTIVIDPCIKASERAGFGPEVIENVDLILISHGHWDHITDLKYLIDKFGCPVLCGELTAPALLKMLNSNPAEIYPMTPNLELDFNFAKIRALFGRHTNQHRISSELLRINCDNSFVNCPEMELCSFYGDLEYRNYLITASNGLKMLFWGSNVTNDQLNIIREIKPDIAMLQYTKQKPEELADLVKAGEIKILIPHHMDLAEAEEVYNLRIMRLEEEMKKIAPQCLVITPERLKWYQFGISVSV